MEAVKIILDSLNLRQLMWTMNLTAALKTEFFELPLENNSNMFLLHFRREDEQIVFLLFYCLSNENVKWKKDIV